MNITRTTILTLALALITTLILAACNDIDKADIPEILNKTVGTPANTSFISDISDNKEYRAHFSATFEDTTEDDYAMLMAHYQSASTGTGENGSLLFDWGWLDIASAPDNSRITVYAYIK